MLASAPVAAKEVRPKPDHQREQKRDGDPVAPEQVAGEQYRSPEARRWRPRRPGVRGLIDEVREPGTEQDPGTDERRHGVSDDAAPVVGVQPDRDQREDGAGAEEHSPRVRVEHQRLAQGEHDQVLPPPVYERMDERGRGNESEQPHQLVHPRLLRVVRQPGVEREQHRGHQPGPAAEQAPARPHPDRDRQQSQQQRQRMRGGLARAECPDGLTLFGRHIGRKARRGRGDPERDAREILNDAVVEVGGDPPPFDGRGVDRAKQEQLALPPRAVHLPRQ